MKNTALEKILSHESLEELSEVKSKGKRAMAWRLSIFFTAVFIGIIVFVGNSSNSLISYFCGLAVILAGMTYLYITKNANPLFLFYAIAGSIVAQSSSWFVPETLHYSDLNWMLICTVLAFIGVGSRTGAVVAILNLCGVFYYIFFCHNDHITFVTEMTTSKLTAVYAEILLGFIILSHLLIEFNKYQKMWQSALVDMTAQLSEQNEVIQKANTENITLLKEIHHRVKNNLQIIVSLLRLHKNELQSTEAKQHFQEAINRVMVMSNIHKNLYQQKNLSQIELSSYLQELGEELKSIYFIDKKVEIEINCVGLSLNLKTIIPIGLLCNELIINSLKHAFAQTEIGKISLSIHGKENELSLTYSDNGQWIENSEANGFGQELIQIFTDQLNGDFERLSDADGTQYEFHLQKMD